MEKNSNIIDNENTIVVPLLQQLYDTGTFDCLEYYHKGQSCEGYILSLFLPMVKVSVKYYGRIHFYNQIIFNYKTLLKNPLQFFFKLFKAIFRSSMFMTFLQCSIQYFFCKINNSRQIYKFRNSFYASTLAGYALLWEPASRRDELTLFTLPFALEIVFAYLKKRNYVNFLHKNYELIFAVAMAILVYQYLKKNQTIKKSYQKLFEMIWGQF